MKRHLIRISLVMLLGVVTSVAVAWGCAWRFDQGKKAAGANWRLRIDDAAEFSFAIDIGSDYWWEGSGFQSAGYASVDELIITTSERWKRNNIAGRLDAAQRKLAQLDSSVPAPPKVHRYENRPPHAPRWIAEPDTAMTTRQQIAAGWPALCLRGARSATNERNGLLRISSPRTSEIDVPYAPIWPGLLANTAIYGSVWFAILFGPGLVLRWRRRRAGRCANCGYDLRGRLDASGNASPECGAGQ